MPALIDVLRPALEAALHETSRDRPAGSGDSPPSGSALAERVLDSVAHDPDLTHLANAEPWYRSRVTLGALVSAATPLLAVAIGRDVTAEEQAGFLAVATVVGTLVGSALTLYGRWIARRPIGS